MGELARAAHPKGPPRLPRRASAAALRCSGAALWLPPASSRALPWARLPEGWGVTAARSQLSPVFSGTGE